MKRTPAPLPTCLLPTLFHHNKFHTSSLPSSHFTPNSTSSPNYHRKHKFLIKHLHLISRFWIFGSWKLFPHHITNPDLRYSLNRYSLPVTRRGNLYDNIDQTNAAGFLFRDDDSPADSATYSAVKTGIPEDNFPKLYAQNNMVSLYQHFLSSRTTRSL